MYAYARLFIPTRVRFETKVFFGPCTVTVTVQSLCSHSHCTVTVQSQSLYTVQSQSVFDNVLLEAVKDVTFDAFQSMRAKSKQKQLCYGDSDDLTEPFSVTDLCQLGNQCSLICIKDAKC